MIINYERSFLKDIKKLNNKQIANKIKDIIKQFEDEDSLSEFSNIKKLKGHKIYYRIKISDYRLGFSYENNSADLIRFLHRKDIYKLFP